MDKSFSSDDMFRRGVKEIVEIDHSLHYGGSNDFQQVFTLVAFLAKIYQIDRSTVLLFVDKEKEKLRKKMR